MVLARLVLAILFPVVLSQSPESEEALREAARRGDVERVEALLAEGVDVDAGNRYRATALFFACDKGHLEVVRLLVANGASLDIQDTFYQMTASSRAMSNGHLDVARFLIEKGAPGVDQALLAGVREGDLALVEVALAGRDLTREVFDRAQELSRERDFAEGLALLERADPPRATSRPAVEMDARALSRFSGLYQNDAVGRVMTVEVQEGSLVVRDDSDPPAPTMRLAPTGETSFDIVGEEEGTVAFPGRGGMIERMVVSRNDALTAYRPIDEAESRERAPEDTGDPVAPADLGRRERGAPVPWPAFRGRDRSGIADGQGLVLEWDAPTSKNIAWKTPIPGFSVSSPIIWKDRVFVLTAVSSAGDDTFRIGLYGDVRPVDDLSEHRWLLFALDKATGAVLWERELYRGVPRTKRHTKSSQANATPVTDGTRIVNVLGTVGLLVAHDFDGNLLWERDIGVLNSGWFYDPDYQWGHSNSPLIYKDRVILQADIHQGSFIAAYDLATGEELWRTAREDEIPTFSSPTLYRGATGDEIVTNGTQIRSYDARTGKPLWFLGPNSEIPIGVPVVTEDMIYVTAGYPPVRPIYAIRPGARGDISLADGTDSSEAIVWSKNRGGTYIPSPLIYRGYFYTNANNGRLTCYDAATGERVYRARIGGVGGSYAASPIAADDRLYFTSEEGETFVVQAGSEYKLLARNTVDEIVLSTPAASDGLLVIRSLNHVFGIGEPGEPSR